MNIKKLIVTGIAIFVGLLHFVIGPKYQGPFKYFFNCYLIDILLPFTLFLLFGFFKYSIMEKKLFRAFLVFLVGVGVEILQYFEVPIFGSTFDPLDFLMYGLGILLGLLFERFLLSKLKNRISS